MKLKEIMTPEVIAIHSEDSLQTAAKKMRDHDIGFLPVYEGDQLVGVLTDRDIILRAVAEGVNPKTSVGRELMTAPVICCFDDENVEEAARMMHDNQIRRLAIMSRDDNHLVGIISLGDLAVNGNDKMSARVLQKVSEPTGLR